MHLLLRAFQDMTRYGLEKVLGRYYSVYRGWVANNNDPNNQGRLLISCPEVYGEQVPNLWAWPISAYAGKGYGAHVIPQINDLIWVSFEKGDPRKPLWNFGYFTKDTMPDDLTDPTKYWFRSPKGFTILFDDKNETITLYKKDGTIQPMVLGDTLNEKLDSLVDIIKTMKINTQLGPQGILPIFSEQLNQLKSEFKDFKSQVNKLS